MRIVCTTTFLDDRTRYEEGDVRTVSDEDGQRFVDNGWAAPEGEQPAATQTAAPVTLAVHGARAGVTDTKGA